MKVHIGLASLYCPSKIRLRVLPEVRTILIKKSDPSQHFNRLRMRGSMSQLAGWQSFEQVWFGVLVLSDEVQKPAEFVKTESQTFWRVVARLRKSQGFSHFDLCEVILLGFEVGLGKAVERSKDAVVVCRQSLLPHADDLCVLTSTLVKFLLDAVNVGEFFDFGCEQGLIRPFAEH